MELAFAALHQLCAPVLDELEVLPARQREALRITLGLHEGPVPDRFLVGLAVLSQLAAAAEQRPLVCVVDDEQWLDQASAQVLAFVARRLGMESVGLIFSARVPTRELTGLPQLPIEGLKGQDTRALLETVLTGPVDAQVREELIAKAGGNPLALLELPRGLAPAQLAGGFGLPGVLPRSGSIEETFQRRVGALPADARRLLLLAAAEPAGQPHGRETTRPAHPGGTVPASAQPAARTRAGAPPANRERRPLSPGLAGHARDRPQAFVTSEAAGRHPRPGRPSRGACDPRARPGEVVQDA